MDSPQTSIPSIEQTLVPTTDEIAEECPRFRILIVGRSGVGKSSLINVIFKASLADVRHFEAGTANINAGITSPHNKHLVIHDSEGYEPGDEKKYLILEKFMTERSQKETIGERLHAIWLCITSPYVGGPIFQAWDEKIFRLNQRRVPIIVVYTKFDLYMANNQRKGQGSTGKGDSSLESAEKHFYDNYGQLFAKSTQNIEGQIPYTIISKFLPETLLRLIEITRQNIRVEATTLSSGLSAESVEDFLDAIQITFATAQRVDTSGKINASIKVGKRAYWRAVASGINFLNFSFKKCLAAIHQDLVAIWDIREMEEFFLSEVFFLRMLVFVREVESDSPLAPAGPTNLRASGVNNRWPEHVRCLMGYVVDLTLILQAVFLVSLQDDSEGNVSLDRANEVVYTFYFSEKKKRIHNAIRDFQPSFTKGDVVDKIESLIKGNEMTKIDTQFDLNRLVLPSLLRILRFELSVNGLIVNRIILELTRKLFDSPDYVGIVSEIRDQIDVEILFDFNLLLLHTDSLATIGIQDGNRKARALMFKLITETNVMPRSLFITDIKIDNDKLISSTNHMPTFISVTDIMSNTDLDTIDMAQFGCILQGQHEGKQVALKVVHKGRKHNSRGKDFYREVLAWRSLTHRFVLPLLGIFEKKSYLFLVSPLKANGTLIQWRKNQAPIIAEIHRLMLEVAEGVQYLHSECIVHGDLRGENILLDSAFHCQISDIGSTWDSNLTTLSALNFSAPELFAMCSECHQFDCDGCHSDEVVQRKKTMQTDVYAFACLLYAIFFDTVPLEDENPLQIPWYISRRGRPARLNNPAMDDGIWNLIEQCWMHNPAERPTIEQIVETYVSFLATLPSLLTTVRELAAGRNSIVNDLTHRLMRRLLEQYESDSIVSELRQDSDLSLFLDFALRLLHNGGFSNSGMHNANRKVRDLMFKLIESSGLIPKPLFITHITRIGHNVFEGEGKENQVMLQVVYKLHGDDLRRKNFYREALTWKSLAHRFVLPLVGIFEEKLHQLLVLPFMEIVTLSQWRRNQSPGDEAKIDRIQRLMLEVAEGVRYLHSEGIVHGDLRGENILVDTEFHCRITNIGLTRRPDTITSLMINFAAPELFNHKSGQSGLDNRPKDHILKGEKTVQTDVYEFGCLSYTIFFDTVPFQGIDGFEITRLVTSGKRPDRLSSPKLDDGIWNVIDYSWAQNPSKRPTMERIVQTGMKFTSIPLLLANLRELEVLRSSMVNDNTVGLICELLALPETDTNTSELKSESDVELLLTFVIDLLRSGRLPNDPNQGANRKARRLMFKLISMTSNIPSSLFIANVTNLEGISAGGFGRVFKGSHGGKHVAVKELYKVCHQNTLLEDLCREALVWRSLSHRFILPLLGIYKGKSEAYLVSEFMPNGTITEWRKLPIQLDVAEIHRLMLEVAVGVHYLHSEGIVHGDLHGGNVLLDSKFHCQITDFGLTRHVEATVAMSTRAFLPNFAAPELFGMCTECCQQDCEGCTLGDDAQHRSKTTKTDVYAFGCLYYAIFFDTTPFQGNSDLQIMRRILTGARPDRLHSPSMDDDTWNVIQSCWNSKPSERPEMEQIVKEMTLFAEG